MATQWPLVVARLVAVLPTLPNWDEITVCDGAAYDVQTVTYATVAHATDGVTTTAGSYTKTQAPDGFQYIEQGSVACQIGTFSDGSTVTELRALIFGLLDSIEDAIRADRRLGVLSQEGTSDLTVDVSSMQSIPGSNTTLAFTLTYFTVT